MKTRFVKIAQNLKFGTPISATASVPRALNASQSVLFSTKMLALGVFLECVMSLRFSTTKPASASVKLTKYRQRSGCGMTISVKPSAIVHALRLKLLTPKVVLVAAQISPR